MIAYLKGTLTYKSPTYVIVEVNGIGYEVPISLHTYNEIQSMDKCKLYTYFHVKEDAQILYGFFEPSEKKMFEHLISVSGIGPNTARLVLSALNVQDIRSAILAENVNSLKSIKGIGPKTAKRAILELKDKLVKEGDPISKTGVRDNTIKEDALSALAALGVPKSAAIKALDRVLKANASPIGVGEIVKQALKLL